jgi:purine-binding chemotaxis protein CheW
MTAPDSARRGAIDWDAIKRQLEHCRRAADDLFSGDPQAILRQRAEALAAGPAAQAEQAPGVLEVLVFLCGGERYAFETAHVAHVCPRLPITRIPGTPNWVAGIVAIEGEVVSVLDLRSLLRLPVVRLVDQEGLILLRGETMEFGVMADAIVGVERYAAATLEPTLPTLAGIEQTYLSGIAPDRTAILNALALLADPALVVDAA